MTPVRTHAVLLAGLLAFAAVSFGTGIGWGLPSREADRFLFGNRTPWTGAEVMALAGPWQPAGDRGSDRPQHAAAGPATRPTVLNATDADRAQIVRRYRLYSDQPDEMITFRSLSRMRPTHGDLDPRLYQYGGLWIYPVGGLLRLAAAAHLLTLRTDLAFYLDHAEAFGRFYLLARLYSAAWGLIGVVVVFGLVRELLSRTGAPDVNPGLLSPEGRRTLAAATAAGVYAAMPVVVNAAHEAKPHLAGTVLTLATVWAAARFVRTGRGWATVGVLAGAAAGMILTGVAAWVVLPVMAWQRSTRAAVLAGLVAVLTFAVTNPYLPFDLLFHRERLASNVGNYGTFYRPGLSMDGIVTAGQLWEMGTSPVPAVVAAVGVVMWMRQTRGTGTARHEAVAAGSARPKSVRIPVTWVTIAPAAWVAAQFALLAAGKPAEYARFALTLDVLTGVLAAATVARLPLKPREANLAGLLLVVAVALYGMRYDLNFLADNGRSATRRTVARQLAGLATAGRTLVVSADPAPYGLPAVDLFAWRIVLLPPNAAPADVGPNALAVHPTDRTTLGLPSPISWADKPFEIVPVAGGR